MDLKGKFVLVTGASRGIGRAFARAAARENANLILAVRKTDDSLNAELLKLGAPSVRSLVADLSAREGVDRLVQQLADQQVDVLFNNAGLLTGGLLEEQPLEDIYAMLQVNVSALIHLTHALLPGMIKRKQGKIINHSSVSAVMHFPCASTYAASKAAVWAFTDCLQQELHGTGVSTLCLFTPGVKTEMFDRIDVLYSKNMNTPKGSVSPDEYAERIISAVRDDQVYLEPSGATGAAFWSARYLRGLFNFAVSKGFHRS